MEGGWLTECIEAGFGAQEAAGALGFTLAFTLQPLALPCFVRPREIFWRIFRLGGYLLLN